MAKNELFNPAYVQTVICSDPNTPASGVPARYGNLTGVALLDEGDGGVLATQTVVDFGPRVWSLSVVDSVGGGIAVGDILYYADGGAVNPVISNTPTGYKFGVALAAIGAGQTATIAVYKLTEAGAYSAGSIPGSALENNAVTEAKVATGTLSGASVKNTADANVVGGIPVLFRQVLPDAAGSVDIITTHKIRVVDAWVVKTVGGTGANAVTVQVLNGANAISDAMSLNNKLDTDVVRAAKLDDANHEIAAAGTLRFTTVKPGGDANCIAYVLAIRVA